MATVDHRDDRRLVEAYRLGEEQAFAAIVERFHGPLLRHATRRLGDPGAAEDAVQETYLRACRGLNRFEGDYQLGGWLHRILENVCHDEANRRLRERQLLDSWMAQPLAPSPDVERQVSIDLRAPEVVEALATLPPPHREAIVLRAVDDRPYDEIAGEVGISEDNARARVSRARSSLRRLLEGAAAFVVLSPGALRRPQRVLQALTPSADSAGAALQASEALNSHGPTIAAKIVVAVGVTAAITAPAVHERVTAPSAPAAAQPAPAVAAPPPAASPAPEVRQSGPGAAAAEVDSSSARGQVGVAAPGPDAGTRDTVDQGQAPATSPTTTAVTPTTVAVPRGSALVGDALVITEAGPRLDVTGDVTFDDGNELREGTISGKVLLGDEDPAGPSAPRSIDGTVMLTFADGSTLELRLVGTTTVETRGSATTYRLSGDFRMDGARGAADGEGTFEGQMTRDANDAGTLRLDTNDGPAPEESGGTSTTS